MTEEESSPAAAATILCSKCQLEFEAGPEGREKFHFHLLDCGGVQDVLDTGKKKKKKKRGMGGGLKSTVRMLKKSESVGEGTDTGNTSRADGCNYYISLLQRTNSRLLRRKRGPHPEQYSRCL